MFNSMIVDDFDMRRDSDAFNVTSYEDDGIEESTSNLAFFDNVIAIDQLEVLALG